MKELTVRTISKDLLPKISRFSDLRGQVAALNLSNETIANVTHFLQAESLPGQRQFKKNFIGHLSEVIEQIDLGKFIWDVPFAPVQSHKFTFIDLFAGNGGMRIAFRKLGQKNWKRYERLTK